MQTPGWIRGAAATACALGLVAGPVATAYAAPSPTPTKSAAPSASPSAAETPAKVRATPADQCTGDKVTLLNFNDFHGRLTPDTYDTKPTPPKFTASGVLGFFGEIEKQRAAAGGDDKTIVYSNGDSIGGSLFSSAAQDDNPTIDILNAAQIDGHSTGNHEFDKGAKDFTDRVKTRAQYPYQSANVVDADGKPIAEPFHVYDKAGVKVAVVGAVTGELPSLVSPAGLNGWTVKDPVDTVNQYVAQLKDGNPDNGEADIVVAAYHEGAPGSSADPKVAPASGPAFDKIVNKTDSRVAAILNAHTHGTYAYQAPVPGMTGVSRPVVQSGSYASHVGKIELAFDASKQVRCYTATNIKPLITAEDAVRDYPRAAAIKPIVDAADARAEVIGAQVIGKATAPIAREAGASRKAEGPLSDMVAQMFYDQLSAGNKNFIGMQNPGGTRADIDEGDITYKEAASVLPFANTLMTTEITGAQLKKVLEQQWQPAGASRPYLQMGLSSNVTYTYDESRAEGDRITSIAVNGQGYDPAATYTVGSGSFLISGGDNFTELGKGKNTKDTGRVDLEAFVDWVRNKELSPDYARQAVSMPKLDALEAGKATSVTLGTPGTLAPDTADMTSNIGTIPANTSAVATINGTKVGTAAVDGGKVKLDITAPKDAKSGPAMLVIKLDPSGTTVSVPVTIKAAAPTPKPDGPLGKELTKKFCGLRNEGCGQHFEKGSVYSSKTTGEHTVKGEFRDKWASMGWENSKLGYPTSEQFCGLKDGGCAQRFERGLIYSSPKSGTHAVYGLIGKAYADVSWERSPLGYPVGEEFCGLKDGGCAQRFQGGMIFYRPGTGAFPVYGAIYNKYAQLGWESSKLGYPTSGEFCGLKDGGCFQRFQGGSMYWSPSSGAHPVWGLIAEHWGANGWENGRYGYPIWDEQCGPVGGAWECRQSYQGGVIVWNSARGISG